jgi:RES domain-containing protein
MTRRVRGNATEADRADGRKLDELHLFLVEHPTLGLAHPAGSEISQAIKQIALITLAPGPWFRGLVCKNGAPTPQDFSPPDPRRIVVPEQRFNQQGQRVFYLSNSERGAALECRDASDDQRHIWIQRFEIAALEDILDLCSADSASNAVLIEAATYCGDAANGIKRPPDAQPQYLLPRFVADCARLSGAAGLLAPSVEEGTNLVLFRWNDRQVRPESEPWRFSSKG